MWRSQVHVPCQSIIARLPKTELKCEMKNQHTSLSNTRQKTQACNYKKGVEAITYVALVLALMPLQKFPIGFTIFQWKCPLQNENGLAFSKMKLHAWKTNNIIVVFDLVQFWFFKKLGWVNLKQSKMDLFPSQAWNYTQAMAPVALVLAPLQKFLIEFTIFQWKCLCKMKGPCLFKMKLWVWWPAKLWG